MYILFQSGRLRGMMFLFLLLAQGVAGVAGHAEARRYTLDPEASFVAFFYQLNGAEARGTMPVTFADIRLDSASLANSSAEVVLNAGATRTGFLFITEALKSPSVLNSSQFPNIRFHSTDFRRDGAGAQLQGDLTLRGVTRPLSFRARFFREENQAPDDAALMVMLTGSVSRSAFGVTGFRAIVDDEIRLDIRVRLMPSGT